MSDVWTVELEKEESALTAELIQQSGEGYTLPMAGPDVLGGVKPVQKTDDMTKKVGIDENGRLWSEKESEQVIEEVIEKYLQKNPIISKESDPTVPEWAKQPEKPTYTAAEVGALPADSDITGPQGPQGPQGPKGEKGEKGEPGIYVLTEGETLDNAPGDATVVIDPYGAPDYMIENIIAEALEVINNDTY